MMNIQVQAVAALTRPVYHFRPPHGWINDPNGPIQVNGDYHLFYQYNPNGDDWGTIHWGHARSRDLLHWEHLPVALAPSNERGELHCFSGSVVIGDDGIPRLFYTSVGAGERNHEHGAEQWLALGTPDLMSWRKSVSNPLLQADMAGHPAVKHWRDPFVWRRPNGLWHMVLGGSVEGRGAVLLYASADLSAWRYVGILAAGGEGEANWECPFIIEENGQAALFYSPDTAAGVVRYRIGTIDEQQMKFVTESEGVLDYGGRQGYYAPTAFRDEQGRHIIMAWMPETRGTSTAITGWAGVHALPREVTLAGDKLTMRPIRELAERRRDAFVWQAGPLAGQEAGEMAGRGPERGAGQGSVTHATSNIRFTRNGGPLALSGPALELHLVLQAGEARMPFGLNLLRSRDGQQQTAVRFEPTNRSVVLDRSRSSKLAGIDLAPLVMPLGEVDWNRLELRLFLDHSTVELFIGERHSLSGRVYPDQPTDGEVQLFASAEDTDAVVLLEGMSWRLSKTV